MRKINLSITVSVKARSEMGKELICNNENALYFYSSTSFPILHPELKHRASHEHHISILTLFIRSHIFSWKQGIEKSFVHNQHNYDTTTTQQHPQHQIGSYEPNTLLIESTRALYKRHGSPLSMDELGAGLLIRYDASSSSMVGIIYWRGNDIVKIK